MRDFIFSKAVTKKAGESKIAYRDPDKAENRLHLFPNGYPFRAGTPNGTAQ